MEEFLVFLKTKYRRVEISKLLRVQLDNIMV